MRRHGAYAKSPQFIGSADRREWASASGEVDISSETGSRQGCKADTHRRTSGVSSW